VKQEGDSELMRIGEEETKRRRMRIWPD